MLVFEMKSTNLLLALSTQLEVFLSVKINIGCIIHRFKTGDRTEKWQISVVKEIMGNYMPWAAPSKTKTPTHYNYV